MKKLLLTALVVVFGSCVSYAQPATAPKAATKAPAAVKAAGTKSMAGKVKSVTVADQTNGGKSEITLVGEKSMGKAFLVKSTTTIYDADFKAVSLDKIKAEDKVNVKYTKTKDGIYEATSINLVK
jgi:hypothetical protein